jgi:hypothetical protein
MSEMKGFFWWRDTMKLLISFKGMAMINLQDSATLSSMG